MSNLRVQKQALRLEMKALRAQAKADDPEAGSALRDVFLRHLTLPPHFIIGGYVAFGSEIDPAPLIHVLRQRGHAIALPVVVEKGQPLLFRAYNPGSALVKNRYGIMEPDPAAAIVRPDILLVPLLAFDRQLYRLGYGGGYYDRSIRQLRAIKPIEALGLGFACQQVATVLHDEHDAPLDRIITEAEVFPH